MSVRTVNREHRIEFLSQMIREGSDYKWQNDIERKIWTEVADDILRDHLRGKKTLVSEACFRAYVEKNDVLLAESAAKLNEGFFDGLKDLVGGGLAKTFGKVFGGTKSRNWWIFGGGGEKENQKYLQAYQDATEENQEVFAKLGDKTLKNLIDQVKQALPDWPNGGSVKEFTDVMSKFVQYYESIRTAAGVKTTDGQEPPKGEPPKISVEDANKIIAKMRKAMQYFDRELKDRYTYNLESRTRRMPTLTEALLLEAEEDDDIGAEGRKTSGMKGLQSNLAPAILAGLGLGTAAAGFLVQSDWFIKLTSKIVETPGKAPEFVQEYLGDVTSLNGDKGLVAFIQKVNPGAGITWNSSPEQLLKAYGQLGGKSTVEGGLEVMKAMHGSGVLGKGVPGVDEAFTEVAKLAAAGKGPKNMSGLTEFMKSTGTHKLPLDKLKLDIGPIYRTVMKSAGTEATKSLVQGQIAAKLTALGPWGVGIGAGLIASAAAIKSLRDYGAKNSRTTYFQAAIDQFKDIKPDEVPEIPQETTPPETEPAEAGKVKVTINKGDEKSQVRTEKTVVEQGGFEMPPQAFEDAPIGDKEKAKEAVIKFAKAMNGPGLSFAKGMTVEKFAELEFEITDKREKKKKSSNPTEPGKGPLGVIAIKDGYVPSLSSVLFESGDLRTVTNADAKKSDVYKKLKKQFRKEPDKLTVPADFDAKEDDAITRMVSGNDKKDAFSKTDTPSDDLIRKGLTALRKKAKSGSLILTFDNGTYEELVNKVGLDAPKIKELLKIYSKNPDAAPKITAYNKVINSVTEKEKKELLKNILMNTGMATKAGKKNEALDGGSDNLIIERWSRLAGLI